MGKCDHNYCINMNLFHEILSKCKILILLNKNVTLILLGGGGGGHNCDSQKGAPEGEKVMTSLEEKIFYD